jgi:hypothetical protein
VTSVSVKALQACKCVKGWRDWTKGQSGGGLNYYSLKRLLCHRRVSKSLDRIGEIRLINSSLGAHAGCKCE